MNSIFQCEHGHKWSDSAASIPDHCPICHTDTIRVMKDANASEMTLDSLPAKISEDETLERPPVPKPLKYLPPPKWGEDVAESDPPTLEDTVASRPRKKQAQMQPKAESLPEEDSPNPDMTRKVPGKETQIPAAPQATMEFKDNPQQQPWKPKTNKNRSVVDVHFDNYEVLSVLGRGGMGVVYKARQTQLNRMTALKMVLAGGHASEEDLARFQTEARAVASLQHPNIVQIYEIGQQGNNPFLALEFVDGGSLSDLMEGKPLPTKVSAKMVCALAGAMHYAHEKGIIHRDLKPANIMLTKKNKDPKITDFGLAKEITGDSQQTQSGTIMGTPSYMAPEQANGKIQDIGPTSDIYSLGAILYALLTGRPPFQGESVLDTLEQVRNTEPVPLRRLQPNVPRDLEIICLKCLRKEPAKRYPNSGELADDLNRFLSNQPIHARPVSLTERSFKWARRHPVVATLLVLLTVVLVGGFFLLSTLYVKTQVALNDAIVANAKEKKATEFAELKQEEAEERKRIAEQQKRVAEEQKREAETQKRKAELNYKQSQSLLYVEKIHQVHDHLHRGHPERAEEMLAEIRRSQKALIGFEWDYLSRKSQSSLSTLRGHTNRIRSFTLNRNRTLLATASHDQSIRLWKVNSSETATGVEEWVELPRHDHPIRAHVFSPDGRFLASATTEGKISVWDVRRKLSPRLPVFPILPEMGPYLQMSLVSSLPGMFADPKPRRLLWRKSAHKQVVQSLTFTNDGTLLASGGNDGRIRVFESRNGKEKYSFDCHKYPVTCVAFNPQGDFLASGSEDRMIFLWDLQRGQQHGLELVGHSHWISSLAFSPDGNRLASGSWDQSIRLWDLFGKKAPILLAGSEGHQAAVRDLGFSPDGTRLASVDKSNIIKIWDLLNPNLLKPKTRMGTPTTMPSVAFSTDSSFLASLGINELDRELPPAYEGHQNAVTALALARDNESDKPIGISASWQLINNPDQTRSVHGEIAYWDLHKRTTIRKQTEFDSPIRCLATDPEQRYLACGTEKGVVHLRELHGDKQWQFQLPDRIVSLIVLPEKQTVAVAADDKVFFWNWDYGNSQDLWVCKQGKIRQLAYSPATKQIAIATDSGSVLLKQFGSDAPFRILKGHDSVARSLSFDAAGKRLATGGEDQRIVLWDVDSGKLIKVLRGHTETVTALEFSPTENRLASASPDTNILLWDLVTFQEVLKLENGHTEGITDLAFTEDGATLVSAGWDGVVRVWESR